MGRKRQKELAMNAVREILRQAMVCGRSSREVGISCRVSHSTVQDYLRRVKEANLGYEQIRELDDRSLRDLLLRPCYGKQDKNNRTEPDWAYVHQELRRKGVTRQLLWEEYKEEYPQGYQSTQFCNRYRQWQKTLKVSMRQTHKAGEKMFVDYAGQTVPIQDRQTGKTREAQIFVAVLGASNYTFAEGTLSQKSEDWISSHQHAYEYFQGVTKITVPDNLKSGVSQSCRYEPWINSAYYDMAKHYGTVIIPARPVRPKDKAKVEVGVQIVSRWILARLRNRTFFSVAELNRAIRGLLVDLNNRPFQKLDGSRSSWYETLEKPALLPLPMDRYEITYWKKARVNIDYHVELQGHYYSTPYALVGKDVHICHTARTVEILYNNKRVASHLKSNLKGRHTTVKSHMPKSHQQYLKWTPSRMIEWARQKGPWTAKVIDSILNSRQHPEQGYRSSLGVLRLGKSYGDDRLEAACQRAFSIGGHSYRSVRSILEKNLDQDIMPESKVLDDFIHENIRGHHYYKSVNQEDQKCYSIPLKTN